jgi:hypothetical protein
MMVIDDICKKCKSECISIFFQQNFKNWTSGNNYVDKFIQSSQLSAHNNTSNALVWIPYERLHDIRCITEDKFKVVYMAN